MIVVLKTGGGDRYPDLAFIETPKYLVTLSKCQLFCLRSICLSWMAELLYHLTDQHVQKLNLFTCQFWIKIICCAHKTKRIHLISNGFSAGFHILLILRYEFHISNMAQSAGFHILLILRYEFHISNMAQSVSTNLKFWVKKKLELSQSKTGLAGPIQNGEPERRHTTTGQRDQKEDR